VTFWLTLLLYTQISPGVPVDEAESTFDSAVLWMVRGQRGRAITQFLTVAGRYKRSPLAPWGLYYAACLNEVKGDFLAARRNFQRAVDEYRHPYATAIRRRIAFLDAGLRSGGAILFGQWRRLMTSPTSDLWARQCAHFLKRAKRFHYSGRLLNRLAAWQLGHHRVTRAAALLKQSVESPDAEAVDQALRALIPILADRADTAALDALAAKLRHSSQPGAKRHRAKISRVQAGISLTRRTAYVAWGIMGLFLLSLIFPRKKRRRHLTLVFAPLAGIFWFIPGPGPVLATIVLHLVLLVWLYGKKRSLPVRAAAAAYLLCTPLLALVLTNRFPYAALFLGY